ncbi:MAG TPA: ABC transporter ATP-binding protein [Candidatus Limnocylindrales bacterium]
MSAQLDAYAPDEVLGRAYDARLVRRLGHYLQPYRGQVIVALAGLLLLTITAVAPAILIKLVIDNAITPVVEGTLSIDDGITLLAELGLVFLVVIVVRALLRYGQNMLVMSIGQRAMRDLRSELFAHIEGLSLSFFDHNPVGRLMTRLANDVDALADLLTQGVVAMLGDLLLIAGAAVVLVYLDWRLALVIFGSLPVVIGLTIFFRGRLRDSFVNQRIRLARINAYLNEHLSGMAVVQLFTRERTTYEAFDVLNDHYREANFNSIRIFSTFMPAISITRAVTTAALFIAGGAWVIGGTLTVGTLVAFWQLLDQFFSPIEDLSDKYSTLQSAMASSERIFRILDTQPEITDPVHPKELPLANGDITFDNVSFAYDGVNWVLRDVDLKINAGESVAIVGATGAGKTSIVSLLARFYDVQKGRILLDGIDIRELRMSDLRRHVAIVLQDPFIFAGTIAANIRLRDETITDEQVRAAARFVNASAFIEKLPNGYQTELTERGSVLSVGQKQLIGFARIVAFNPEVMLVLDEATSSVDTETERLIQEALPKLMEGRTSIVIAHRLSTIQHADRIIVLQHGRVVETGSHAELLAKQGTYRQLYELQYGLPSQAA